MNIMKQRLGTIYTADKYVEIEVLDDNRSLATYVVINSNNSSQLNFDIEKANDESSYTSNWLDNNEDIFFAEWERQRDGKYVW